MITLRSALLAVAGTALLPPLAALANPQPQPAETPPAREEAQPAEAQDNTEAADADKRICRYVKLETASRRKTKVCRTLEEWRELNNPR